MDIDENNHVHYKNAARLVGELIKRFFSPKMISLKTKFDKIRIVDNEEKVKGWTDEEITKETEKSFSQYDLDKSKGIDFEEFRKLIKK